MASPKLDSAPFGSSDMIIVQELGDFIKSKSSTFACGGSIPIVGICIPLEFPVLTFQDVVKPEDTKDSQAFTSSPIDLRWDTASSNSGVAKLTFPVKADGDNGQAALEKLIRDCQPASFGYKGEDVLDESYRKAIKMDTTAFSVAFCPYEAGIIDVIAQVLLPNASNVLGTKGVRAELYKLNVRHART